jgi:adenylosuccinate lyase
LIKAYNKRTLFDDFMKKMVIGVTIVCQMVLMNTATLMDRLKVEDDKLNQKLEARGSVHQLTQ